MPLRHFNLHDRTGLVPDDEGRELPDIEEARAEALKGALLFAIRFSEAVSI
jgi:hypothetical protein